jgi:hypothetical protein
MNDQSFRFESLDISVWGEGFEILPGVGMICEICRSLVRQSPSDLAAHLQWHDRLSGGE